MAILSKLPSLSLWPLPQQPWSFSLPPSLWPLPQQPWPSSLGRSASILALLALPLALHFRGPLQYPAKMALYYLAMTIECTILLPYVALRPRRLKNVRPGAQWNLWLCRWLLGLSYELEGEGEEEEEKVETQPARDATEKEPSAQGPAPLSPARQHQLLSSHKSYVVVMNHQSSLDMLALCKLWTVCDEMNILSKSSLLFSGPFGIYSYLCGVVFVSRSNREEAKRKLEEAVLTAKATGTKLLVFPEGTRHHSADARPPRMLPFRKGAFAAAIKAQLPILPVVVSHYKFLDTRLSWSGRFDRGGRPTIRVLQPIETRGMTLERDLNGLTERTRAAMQECFGRT